MDFLSSASLKHYLVATFSLFVTHYEPMKPTIATLDNMVLWTALMLLCYNVGNYFDFSCQYIFCLLLLILLFSASSLCTDA